MVRPMYRSRTFRRVFKKTSGRVSLHYIKRKPAKAKCAECGSVLQGVPRAFPYKIKLMSKTKKRPERMYGGYLCGKCTKKSIINKHIKE